MSRRKKSPKRKSGGRRRVSGVGGAGMQLVMGAGVGAIVAQIAVSQAQKMLPTIKENMLALGQVAIGGFIAMKTKNPMIVGAGLGLVGSGALSFGKSFGLISGVGAAGNLVTFSRPMLNGTDLNLSTVSGYEDLDDNSMGGMGDLATVAGMM